MLGRQKARIYLLTSMLRELEDSPRDLRLLESLQLKIVALISSSEKHIDLLRKQAGEFKRSLSVLRMAKGEASIAKMKIRGIRRRVGHYQWLLSIWRTFGDGIAFIYLDLDQACPIREKH